MTLNNYNLSLTAGLLTSMNCSQVLPYKVIAEILYVIWSCYISRLTVVSREAKKKQHACASSGPRDHYSELFTRMAALKF